MKKLYIVLFTFSAALFMNSCVESEISFFDDAEDLGFTGSQEEIEDFLSSEVYDVMFSLGLDINPGSNPLNVEGTYIADPYCMINSTNPDAGLGCGYAPFYVTFSNQDNEDLTLNYSGRQYNDQGDLIFEEEGSGFISGDAAGNFTVIVRATNSSGSENATALSGQISASGIIGYQDIFVPSINEGNLRGDLFVDDDGVASRQ